MKIKAMAIANFKGISFLKLDFNSITRIMGANATGKTSIFDAFTWVLFNKDSSGSEKFQIRSLDSKGNKIHNTDISVAIEFLNDDGTTTEIHKVQKENWVKKRGSENPVLQGNVNSYEIDGYPKSESEFKKYIAELLQEDVFRLVTNPQAFPALKWQDQRKILMGFIDGISDTDIAKEVGGFDELLPELEKAPDLESIRKKYSKMISEYKKRMVEIPARIDELNGQKTNVDTSALEAEKAKIISEISGLESIADGEIDPLPIHAEIDALRNEQGALINKANQARVDRLDRLNEEKSKLDIKYNEVKRRKTFLEDSIAESDRKAKVLADAFESMREQFETAKAETFDASAEYCTTCGQKLPADKIEQIRSDFEVRKKDRMDSINKKAAEYMKDIKKLKADVARNLETLESVDADISRLGEKITAIDVETKPLYNLVDISGTPEYKAISAKIADCNKRLADAQEARVQADERRRTISLYKAKLNDIEGQLAKVVSNDAIDNRIAELTLEQRTTQQKISDAERMTYLLDSFTVAKMNKVSEEINAHFDGVDFKLFDTQINGGIKETCEVTYNGIPYASLNNGHRIVAGLKIIKALQELYKVNIPVWIDNAEAINEFNLPKMDNQLILLSVSEDKELVVK